MSQKLSKNSSFFLLFCESSWKFTIPVATSIFLVALLEREITAAAVFLHQIFVFAWLSAFSDHRMRMNGAHDFESIKNKKFIENYHMMALLRNSLVLINDLCDACFALQRFLMHTPPVRSITRATFSCKWVAWEDEIHAPFLIQWEAYSQLRIAKKICRKKNIMLVFVIFIICNLFFKRIDIHTMCIFKRNIFYWNVLCKFMFMMKFSFV